jgi:hypothetical protein
VERDPRAREASWGQELGLEESHPPTIAAQARV